MNKLPEWITAIATVVGAGSVLLLWWQIRADHERSRRETAISFLFEWATGLLRSASLARKLAETLTEQEAKDLADEKPLTLPKDKENIVLGCLAKPPEGGLKEENGRILLGVREVSEIRWQVVRYLNLLEILFSASRHNVADKGIVAEQFSYLAEKGNHLLRPFRDALGGETAYPAIASFEEDLKQQKLKQIRGKPRIA